jgi:tetratricopeptide (TPR) repeat protein
MSVFPIRRLLLNVRARYHLWSGRRAYRLGRIRAAGRHFREALAHGLESFEAYLLLGKIYYRENDLARAATFFSRARTHDPARFLLEGFPDDFIDSLRERHQTVERGGARPEYRIVIETTIRRRPRREPVPTPGPGGRYGDFASRDEWLRHKDRPKFRPGDGHDVDWDDAARRLFGE